jgi:hypothetical protein
VLFSFIFLAVTSQSLGCSAVGFWVGANLDNEPQTTEVVPSSYATVEPGSEIRIVLQDGSETTGTFGGQGRLAEKEYAERYNAWRRNQSGDSALPRIGDEFSLLRPSPATDGVSGSLVGFDPHWIHIRSPKGDKELNFWNLALERVYDKRGESIEMRSIKARMERGDIPFMSYIVVFNEEAMTKIPAEKIRKLHLEPSKYRKWVGLLAGLALDFTAYLIYQSIRW